MRNSLPMSAGSTVRKENPLRANINCCYNCHSTCEKYLTQKAEWDETREQIAKQKKIEGEITGTILRGVHQRQHTKHKK